MKRPAKWAPTEKVIDNLPLFERVREHGRMVFVRGFFKGRPVSATVVANMSHALVMHLIYSRKIVLAKQSPMYREWLRSELLGWDEGEYCREVWYGTDGPIALLTRGSA